MEDFLKCNLHNSHEFLSVIVWPLFVAQCKHFFVHSTCISSMQAEKASNFKRSSAPTIILICMHSTRWQIYTFFPVITVVEVKNVFVWNMIKIQPQWVSRIIFLTSARTHTHTHTDCDQINTFYTSKTDWIPRSNESEIPYDSNRPIQITTITTTTTMTMMTAKTATQYVFFDANDRVHFCLSLNTLRNTLRCFMLKVWSFIHGAVVVITNVTVDCECSAIASKIGSSTDLDNCWALMIK